MPLTQTQSNEAANAAANSVAALCDGGFLRIYTTPQPATSDSPIGAVTLLAELTFGSPAFGSAVAGVAAANAIGSDTNAANTGAAAWFRAWKSDGTSPVFDGSVGTSGCNLNLSTTAIVQHGTVAVSSFSYTANES